MDVTACPESGCELPAEILGRRILESIDGPIEHSRIACIIGHRFFMPTASVPERQELHDRARRFAAAASTWVSAPGERWSQ